MGAAGLLGLVVKPDPSMGYGGGRRQRGRGDSGPGGGAESRRGDRR